MVIVRIKGGLGNQLFQYASGYALAQRLKQQLVIDDSFFSKQSLRGYKLDKLNIKYKELFHCEENRIIILLQNKYINKILRIFNIQRIPIGKNKIYLLETRSEIVNSFFSMSAQAVYMDGYYQSEEYFRQYRNILLSQFTPVYTMNESAQKIRNKIINTNSIAVHVRRGDFLKAKNDYNPRHYLLDRKYYDEALMYVNKHIENPIFYWFSDDITWVKEQFGEHENYYYVSLYTENADIDELMLMKKCKHIIAANSTFSWWATWLNENDSAMKIVPRRRYGNIEMIPKSWIKI